MSKAATFRRLAFFKKQFNIEAMNRAINRHEALELAMGNKTRFYFDDLQVLRGAQILAMEVFRTGEVTYTPKGTATISDTSFERAFLVLNSGNDEKVSRIPLTALCAKDNNGNTLNLNGLIVDWPKSYVEFASAPESADQSKALLFSVYF